MKNGLYRNYIGTNFWYKNDLLHRLEGPAIESKSGTSVSEKWCINGKLIDKYQYFEWLYNNGMNIKNLSDEDKKFIELTYITFIKNKNK